MAYSQVDLFKISQQSLLAIFQFGGDKRGKLFIDEHGDVTKIARKLASDPKVRYPSHVRVALRRTTEIF